MASSPPRRSVTSAGASWALLAAVLLAGSAYAYPNCAHDWDCYDGQYCSSGSCATLTTCYADQAYCEAQWTCCGGARWLSEGGGGGLRCGAGGAAAACPLSNKHTVVAASLPAAAAAAAVQRRERPARTCPLARHSHPRPRPCHERAGSCKAFKCQACVPDSEYCIENSDCCTPGARVWAQRGCPQAVLLSPFTATADDAVMAVALRVLPHGAPMISTRGACPALTPPPPYEQATDASAGCARRRVSCWAPHAQRMSTAAKASAGACVRDDGAKQTWGGG